MPSIPVAVHTSQFPENIRRDLLDSLRLRQVNHKFHYDSVKQTAKWLALHQAYSPSRTDPDCAQTYDRAFDRVLERVPGHSVQVIGVGCGGGQKDTRLLQSLRRVKRQVCYVACDASLAMVLEARRTALGAIPSLECFPLVCDLAQTQDLGAVLEELLATQEQKPNTSPASDLVSSRLFTFFGMIPNFEPDLIVTRLAEFVRPQDRLVLSANLAPGADYAAGVKRVLPLYDNELTRDWLLTFLLDVGIERGDGEISFQIEAAAKTPAVLRIAAYFQFQRAREIRLEEQRLSFLAGEAIRLFFSYRHTPELMRSLLRPHGFQVEDQWVTQSGEEGVFLVSRSGQPFERQLFPC